MFDPEVDPLVQKGQVKKKPVKCSDAVAHTLTSVQPTILPEVSPNNSLSQTPSTSATPTGQRPRRSKRVKFVGRNIQHEWIVNEDSGKSEWYKGRVLQVIKGKDGDVNAVYEILYEGEDEPHEVDNLKGDLEDGSLRFIDV